MKDCFGARAAGPAIAPAPAFRLPVTISEGVLVGLARRKSSHNSRRPRGRSLASLRSALTASRRALARRPIFRHALPAGAGCARFRRRRRRGDRRRAQGGLWRHCGLCAQITATRRRPSTRRPTIADDQCPLCRFCRRGNGVSPTRPAGFAGPARSAARASARRRAATFFPHARPAKSGSGASPRRLRIVRRARFGVTHASLSDSRFITHVFSPIRLPSGALASAFVALGTVAAHAHGAI